MSEIMTNFMAFTFRKPFVSYVSLGTLRGGRGRGQTHLPVSNISRVEHEISMNSSLFLECSHMLSYKKKFEQNQCALNRIPPILLLSFSHVLARESYLSTEFKAGS